MNHVMAAGRHAGKLVAFDIVQHGAVRCPFLEIACAQVTMETFAVVKGLVKLDRLMRFAEVLSIDMVEPSKLGLYAAGVQRVIGVAGVTGLVGRHTMILVMRRRNVGRVVNVQAFPVRLHDVTAQAKRRGFGPLHVAVKPQYTGEDGQDKQAQEGEYLPFPRNGNRWSSNNQTGDHCSDRQYPENGRSRHAVSPDGRYFSDRMYLTKDLIWSSVSFLS